MIAASDVTAWDSNADETKAALAIAAITKQIEGRTCLGYSLKYAEASERVASNGGQYLVLPRYPLFEVDTVTLDGEELEDWEQYDNGDRWGWLFRKDGWPAYGGSVRLTGDSKIVEPSHLVVTYGAGYAASGQTVPSGVPALPDDIKMAMIELVLLRLGKRLGEFSANRVQSQSLGEMRITYAGFSQHLSASTMESQILASIRENHRRPQLP